MTNALYPIQVPADDADLTVFPNVFVDAIASGLQAAIPVIAAVVKRPARMSDPNYSLSVYAEDWTPQQIEVGGFGPTTARYNVTVETLIREADEEQATLNGASFAKSVRLMLYLNPSLDVQLRGTQDIDSDLSVIERYQRRGVSKQRFRPGTLAGQMVYLTSTTLWFETEIVPGG